MPQFIKTEDLDSSAQLTLANMQVYYDMYDVDWGISDVRIAISNLNNYDVVLDGEVIGAIRLAYDADRCHLRDIQIKAVHQSKGYGALVIAKVVELAKEKQLSYVDLRVFKRSPAYRLYDRLGFVVESEDDKFYQMSLAVN